MPYADPEKRKAAQKKSRDKYFDVVTVNFLKSDEKLYQSFTAAIEDKSISKTDYAKEAIREKLTKDGYLSE